MKKFVILFLIAAAIACSADFAFARAVGGKLIYNKMLDEYSDRDFDNNLSAGGFFEVGPSFFGSRFRPGFDWVTLENGGRWARVYAGHLDWYWFFLDGKIVNPFVGFGPALNYYNFKDTHTDDDSDAGLEAFGGVEVKVTGPWSAIAEIRLVQHDIANWDQRIIKASVGVVYYF